MQVDGQPAVFLDNPGGTQVSQPVIDAIGDYLAHSNANHGGAFATSQRSDAILDDAHQAVADMLNAAIASGNRVWPEHDDAHLQHQPCAGP